MPLRARLQFTEIEGACLFHAVTRYAGIAASSFRRWAAFAVRLPCPHMGFVRLSRALRDELASCCRYTDPYGRHR